MLFLQNDTFVIEITRRMPAFPVLPKCCVFVFSFLSASQLATSFKNSCQCCGKCGSESLSSPGTWMPEPTGMLVLCFQGGFTCSFLSSFLMNPGRCDHQIEFLSSNVKVLFISTKQKNSSKPYHPN